MGKVDDDEFQRMYDQHFKTDIERVLELLEEMCERRIDQVWPDEAAWRVNALQRILWKTQAALSGADLVCIAPPPRPEDAPKRIHWATATPI